MRQPVICTVRSIKRTSTPAKAAVCIATATALRRQEIRSLYVEIFSCTGYRHDKSLHNLFPRGLSVRFVTICANEVPQLSTFWEIAGGRYQSTIYKIPVE